MTTTTTNSSANNSVTSTTSSTTTGTARSGRRADSEQPTKRVADLREVLTDTRFDRDERLIRLQGWRGDDADEARGAGAALRLAPATCAVLAFAVALTGSLPIAIVTLATAIVGVFAANHPVETVHNAIARRLGRASIPANRAAKRLGCVMGVVFFSAISIALVAGSSTVATVLAVVMGSVAAFVAVTNFCIPSVIFTLLQGSPRATCPALLTR